MQEWDNDFLTEFEDTAVVTTVERVIELWTSTPSYSLEGSRAAW
jgi:hypothetical protein